MKVVILCGGLGTRLREETEYRPKPMVPIGGQPILWHIMKHYASYGHKEFILCLGYKGEYIRDYFRNYHWFTSDVTLSLGERPEIQYHTNHTEEDWKVTLVDTGQKTMTGGRLKRVLPFVGDEPFMLTYGDGVANVDLAELEKFHKTHGGVATLTAIQPSGRFGKLDIDGESIRSFQEKPEKETAYISGGFFMMNPDIEQYLGDDECILEREPLEVLAAENKLNAFRHHGFWQCMDTYREHVMLNEMWEKGDAPWKSWK